MLIIEIALGIFLGALLLQYPIQIILGGILVLLELAILAILLVGIIVMLSNSNNWVFWVGMSLIGLAVYFQIKYYKYIRKELFSTPKLN